MDAEEELSPDIGGAAMAPRSRLWPRTSLSSTILLSPSDSGLPIWLVWDGALGPPRSAPPALSSGCPCCCSLCCKGSSISTRPGGA
eukprot:15043638-Alexandrium_andersonii.AAC.1